MANASQPLNDDRAGTAAHEYHGGWGGTPESERRCNYAPRTEAGSPTKQSLKSNEHNSKRLMTPSCLSGLLGLPVEELAVNTG
jgi:hypothetical protein